MRTARDAEQPQAREDWLFCAEDDRDIPSGAIEKAHLVLGSFPSGRGTVGVSELARRSGVAKSTTHRILQILETTGMVERLPAGYRLGHRLHELADMAGGRSPSQIRECVLPHLLDLYEETHLTVHLAVWSGTDVLIAERLHGRHHAGVPPQVGVRFPAFRAALGKVLLAYADEAVQWRVVRESLPAEDDAGAAGRLEWALRDIRRCGVALGSADFSPGVVCVAAPVRGPRRAPAAISVSGIGGRFDVNAATGRIRRAAYAASSSHCGAERSA